MNILIISDDVVFAAHLQILLASLSKNIVYLSGTRDNASLNVLALEKPHHFDVTFVESNLLEKEIVSAEFVGSFTTVAEKGGVIILTNKRLEPESKPLVPGKSCFLAKPVKWANLKNGLAQLAIPFRKLNCWEYKKCGRQAGGEKSLSLGMCPAALEQKNNGIHDGTNAGRSCWIISGTLCDGEVQGSFATKIRSCLECDFYQLVAEEEKEAFESIDKALVNLEHELTESSVSEGMFRVDRSGAVISFNLAAEKMTGFHSRDLLGKPHQMLFGYPQHAYNEPTPVTISLDSGEIHRSRNQIYNLQKALSFPVQLTSAPIVENNAVIGAVVLFKDITEQLRIQGQKEKAEQELRELAETLEDRVHQRTGQLDRANKELLDTLDRLQQAQKQLVESEKMASLGSLVAGVAHEINTPVGIAYTAATHLEKETKQVIDLYQKKQMKRDDFEGYLSTCGEATKLLCSNLNRAGALVRSFKQVAIDQSVEAMRQFNFRDYLEEVLLSLRPVLKKTKHTVVIDCDDDLVIKSFPGAFSQILTNLITNSVVHAFTEDQAGTIAIQFDELEDRWILRYLDNGKGIESDNLERIFDPFFTTNREKGGSGLGLHIVYNLVHQKLYGSITCESKPGQGTTFTIIIPH